MEIRYSERELQHDEVDVDEGRNPQRARASTQQQIQEKFKNTTGNMSLLTSKRLNAVSQRNNKIEQQITQRVLALRRSATFLLDETRTNLVVNEDKSTKEVVNLLVALDVYRKSIPDPNQKNQAKPSISGTINQQSSPVLDPLPTSAIKTPPKSPVRSHFRKIRAQTLASLADASQQKLRSPSSTSSALHGHNLSMVHISTSTTLADLMRLLKSSDDFPLLNRPRIRTHSVQGTFGTPLAFQHHHLSGTAPPVIFSNSGTGFNPTAHIGSALPGHSSHSSGMEHESCIEEEAAFSGGEGSLKHRSKMLGELAIRAIEANPAGFLEETAQAELAAHKTAVDRCEHWLRLKTCMPADTFSERALRESMAELHYRRPFFAPPLLPRITPARASSSTHREREPPPWDINKSVFQPRKLESESRDYYDTQLIYTRQVALDWSRVTAKDKFRRMIVSSVDTEIIHSSDEMHQILNSLRHVFEQNAILLRTVFTYYCNLGTQTGDTAFTMGANDWRSFLRDCKIMDNRFCRPEIMDTVFVQTNFEEDKETFESLVNNDVQLMRFEFMEALVRVAIHKYVKTMETEVLSEALQMLVDAYVVPNSPPAALHNVDTYRRERLYQEEVDQVFTAHIDLLKVLFGQFKLHMNPKYLSLDRWMAMLTTYNLLGDHTGVSKRQAKLIFCWSQTWVVDEVQRRNRIISLTFVDFLEALARLADVMNPPSYSELEQIMLEHYHMPLTALTFVMSNHPYYKYYTEVSGRRSGLTRQASLSQVVSPDPQPLASKIEALLDYLVQSMMDAWRVSSYGHLVAKMETSNNSPASRV